MWIFPHVSFLQYTINLINQFVIHKSSHLKYSLNLFVQKHWFILGWNGVSETTYYLSWYFSWISNYSNTKLWSTLHYRMSMCSMNAIQKYYIRHVVINHVTTSVNCLSAIHKSSHVALWDSKVKVSSDVYFRISLAESYEYDTILFMFLTHAVSQPWCCLEITLPTSDLNTESGWFNNYVLSQKRCFYPSADSLRGWVKTKQLASQSSPLF